MNHRSCSSWPHSLSACRTASRRHAVPCTVQRMWLCLFRIGVWSCGLCLPLTHRLDVVLWAGVDPATNSDARLLHTEEKKPMVDGLPCIAHPAALPLSLPEPDMRNGPASRLNHSTNIRQYSISAVTVKHCCQLSEIEHVLSLVVCRRGVQFATFEPLADEVPRDCESIALEFFGGVVGCACDLQLP